MANKRSGRIECRAQRGGCLRRLAEQPGAGRARRPGRQGGHRPRRRRSQAGELCHGRQLHPDRIALCLCRPRRDDPGRHVDGFDGLRGEPPVRFGAAGRSSMSAQAILLGDADFAHRRRCRGDVARRLPAAGAALRRAHGRHPGHRRDGRRADRPVRRRPHGHHRRESGRQARHHARGAGCLRRRVADARGQGDRRGPLQVADRADHAEDPQGRGGVRYRRASARPAPRWKRWPRCVPPSRRTAR